MRIARIAPAFVLLTLLAASRPVSGGTPSVSAAWNQLRSVEAGWDVIWRETGQVPEVVRPPSHQFLDGWSVDHAAAVQRFFWDRADLFGLDRRTDELRVAGEVLHGGVLHLRVLQYYLGLPVLGGEYMVSVGAEGDLRLIAGQLYPHLSVDTHRALPLDRAAAAALRARGAPREGYNVRSNTLSIDPEPSPGKLVNRIILDATAGFGSWESVVDARDGRVLRQRDRSASDPGCGTASRGGHGLPMEFERRTFELDHFTNRAALSGPRVNVYHVNGAQDSTDFYQLDPSCWAFDYDPDLQSPDAPAFDQVNVFAHLDWFLGQYMPSYGFPGTPRRVDALIDDVTCRSYTTDFQINFGRSCALNLRSTDVIYHEATHAVLNTFGVEPGDGRPSRIYGRSLHEGWANYYACAANNDSIWGEPLYGEEGAANPFNDRHRFNYAKVDSIAASADIEPSYYWIGMIWSGTMWDLRQRIHQAADSLGVESMFYLPAQISFPISAAALVQADVDLHHGAHVDSIRAVCALRGIDVEPVHASITGPATIYRGGSGLYVASVSYGVPPYTFQWSATGHSSGGDTELDLGSGSQATLSAGTFSSFELRLRIMDAARDTTISRLVGVCSSDPPGDGPLTASIIYRPNSAHPQNFVFSAGFTGGACYDGMAFRWATRLHDPGSPLVERGTAPSLSMSSNRNFDVFLWVTTVADQDSASRPIAFAGMPTVAIAGPTNPPPDDPQRYDAIVTGGEAPAGYHWTLDHNNGVVEDYGTESHVNVPCQPGEFLSLCVRVTTVTGLETDLVCLGIHSTGAPNVDAPAGPTLEFSGGGVVGPEGTVQLALRVSKESYVRMRAFDLAGREVGRIFDGRIPSGYRRIGWSVSGLPAGMYFVRAEVDGRRLTRAVIHRR